MLKEGMTLTQQKVVKESETAAKVASGALEVFSTPMLIAFMENTAFNLAQKELGEGETTVGISVNIKHMKANLVGDEVVCTATLEKVDGKRLDFSVKVLHGETLVGEGEHSRFIINEEKFLAKLKK
ncbi:thioesterase family protein [Fusobacterium sp.]|uniref:thioesterase family protein n=1 Tax=Fusobacterium sp. TaxID=68766 RepID=UPI0026107DD5|nr:thioesterase family protein [Fusobacterium sp.]